MRAYLGFLIRYPRLIVAELFRLLMLVFPVGVFVAAIFIFGKSWGELTFSTILFSTSLALALFGKPFAQALWVSLYAWALDIPSELARPWSVALRVTWAEFSPANIARRWRAALGWSESSQEKDDRLAFLAARDVGAGITPPLLLVARIRGETRFTQLLRIYAKALEDVFQTTSVSPKGLQGKRLIVTFALPLMAGLILMLVGATRPGVQDFTLVVTGFLLMAVAITWIFLNLAAFELMRLELTRMVLDESLSIEERSSRIAKLGFAAHHDTVIDYLP